jgi:hypothetical protein
MTTSAPPRWLPVKPASIPRELVEAVAWYPAIIRPKVGKPGRWDKIPGDPATGQPATWSDPATRLTFDAAFMAYQRDERFDGIGYMMHGDGLIGIDLDHCVAHDGSIAPWALEIVHQFAGAHWERSISGTGLRGFCRGSLPDGVDGRRSKIEGCSVEIYSDLRFLVVTGHARPPIAGLPTLQAAVDAFYARITAGRTAGATGKAVATGMTGRLPDLPPDDLEILGAVMGSTRAARMAEIWARDDLHAAGASEDDGRLACEIAYQIISRGQTLSGLMALADDDRQDMLDTIATTVERIMRAGPYRSKWDEPRRGVTWLAQDCANAVQATYDRLKAYREKHPDFTVDDQADETPAPANETPEQEVIRLQRELAAEKRAHAQTRAVNAVQMTRIRSLVAELEQERALRARDRRVTLADQRLQRVSNYSSTQKDIIKATARLAPALANTHQTDAPIITREMLAEATGGKAGTVGENAKVFDLEGSPIRRVTKSYGAKSLTHFELTTHDPAEIIEKMAEIGEQLERRPAPRVRPTCPTCPEGTGTIVSIVCEGCGGLLEERRCSSQAPQRAEKPHVADDGPPPPTVDDYVTPGAAKPHVAGAPETDELAARRAQAAQAIPLGRQPDKWKRPERPKDDPGDDAGTCKVHHRVLSYAEFEDGGCSWCVTEAAAAEALPLLAGAGGES